MVGSVSMVLKKSEKSDCRIFQRKTHIKSDAWSDQVGFDPSDLTAVPSKVGSGSIVLKKSDKSDCLIFPSKTHIKSDAWSDQRQESDSTREIARPCPPWSDLSPWF